PAVCSETAIAMVLGWYDTNGYTTQWKRFVPWGGNLMAENFEGIWALVWAIVDVLGTDVYPPGGDGVGDGMDDTDWDNAQAVLPQMLQAIDPGAAFTLSYKSRLQNDPLPMLDIAAALDAHGPGVFGTWSTVRYFENDGTPGDFDNHDITAMGYFRQKAPSTLDLPDPPPIHTTADWLLVQSTWTSDAWGATDPLWINWAGILPSDKITYADFAAGGTPTTVVDDTDDPFEDNDSPEHAAPLSWPLEQGGLEANDLDFFSFTVPAGPQTVAIRFAHQDGDLDLWLRLPNGQVLKSESITDDEEISFALAAPGTVTAEILPYGANTYTLASGPLPGDADNDGFRTLADLVLILQSTAGLASPPALAAAPLAPSLAALVLQSLAGLR
ncbi:MAG: PPC domain-containing protein, partial [Pseudomonadota bacterium]